MPTAICQRSGHLAHVRLNRPDHGNRFTTEMFGALASMFTELDADPDVRCTLLTANGEDFSLGVDVPDVLPNWAAGKNPFEQGQVNPFGTTGPRRRKPLVTVVQGQCFNAGLELVFASDICIAADNCRFAFHEMRFGVYPYGGGLFRFIRAAGWNAAMRYSLTSEEFGAAEALRMNVVALVRPSAEAEAAGLALARGNLQCGSPCRTGRHDTGPDMGGQRGSRGSCATGSRYHPVAELTRRGRGDAGDDGGENSELFRAVSLSREHPGFRVRLP